MRRRTTGLVLLGLGAFALAAALAVHLFLVPTLVRLPLDQESTVAVVDEDATYLDRGALEQATGPVYVNLEVKGDPTSPDASDDVAVWASGQSITDAEGNLITDPTETVNCLDRREAVAVACDSATGTIEGLTLTFPIGTEKQDYQVWNGNIGEPVTATYVGEEETEGVDVYRFEISVPETVIDEIQVPGRLAGDPAADGDVDAEVVYATDRYILVEPVSGKIVENVESPRIVLRGPDGTTGVSILDATLAPSDEALATSADGAAESRDDIRLVSAIIPWSAVALGIVLIAIGAFLVLSARRRGEHTFEHDDDERPVPAGVA